MSVLLGVTRGVRSLLAMICTGHHACTKPSQAFLPDVRGRTITLLRRSAKLRSQSGFTLVELLIVLAIGMIVAAMTMPLFNTAVNQYRLRASAVVEQPRRLGSQELSGSRSLRADSESAPAAAGWSGYPCRPRDRPGPT